MTKAVPCFLSVRIAWGGSLLENRGATELKSSILAAQIVIVLTRTNLVQFF